ncbi:serine hydrolase domain-containing protein [Fodinibius sediminis]|uniref:CubicO group peptidase, beta-lactamase class C family n=1 Tax=Fodinibius sediminis TaxID=1214077 RepID=A0A521CKD3_9BACT|nr:serine hydrolase domain-containing protein [Fodinibius sediminis]SMO59884.1 CubicO group peptidase, beta-lactamase class C family [Fodinibius sediminis]
MMKRIRAVILLSLFLFANSCSPDNKSDPAPSAEENSTFVKEKSVKESEIGVTIDRYLSAIEAMGFSGAAVVSKGDGIVLRKGYGLADRESRRPYAPTTVQSHGSITKQMTGAAILLLESRGLLSVDDSIGEYLEDIPEEKQEITIHQLLTHTSGLPGGVGPDDEPIAAPAYVDRLMGASLQFDPGTGYAYSNAGYALLGIIVECVSGRGYEHFLREELLLPAGLTETGYVLPDWDRSRLAAGYQYGEKWGLVYERGWLEEGPGWHLRANGGLHTTIDDMYRWFQNTLRGEGVLSEEIVKRWTTGYITESNGVSQYGYGWVVYDTEWGPMIAHSGSNRIFSADFVWLPEKELFFYIQGNTSMMAASEQRSSVLGAAFNDDFLMPPLIESKDAAKPRVAQEREGAYHLDGGRLELTADDTRLVAKLWGQPALNLLMNPAEEQKKQFAELNRRTRDAMNKLKDGQEDALDGLMREGEDPVAPTSVLLNRINQIGNLDSLHVIGTYANTPGSRFSEYGPWTTFVYAEFAHWNQYWNIVWKKDGTYKGVYSGPWPTVILVPTAENEYTGIRQGPPWDTIEMHFESECLVVDKSQACSES